MPEIQLPYAACLFFLSADLRIQIVEHLFQEEFYWQRKVIVDRQQINEWV